MKYIFMLSGNLEDYNVKKADKLVPWRLNSPY